jgi:hypothetical protein
MARFRDRTLPALAIALAVFALAACADEPHAPDAASAEAAGVVEAVPVERDPVTGQADAPAAPGDAQPVEPDDGFVPPRMSDPLPPQRLSEPVALDRSCRTDADCTVKNVGNCCGAYPSCVNVDSPTSPEAVRAQCEAQGMSSVCGFPEVSGCTCVEGQCRDVTGPARASE